MGGLEKGGRGRGGRSRRCESTHRGAWACPLPCNARAHSARAHVRTHAHAYARAHTHTPRRAHAHALRTRAARPQGLRDNLDVGLQYMEAWLRGVGCVPIHNLMEDAATAEISRCARVCACFRFLGKVGKEVARWAGWDTAPLAH